MEETINITDSEKKIAGVRFRENWKVYDFDADEIELAVGDSVIVDSDRGPGFARVVRLRRIREPEPAPVPAPAALTEPAESEEASIEDSEKKPEAASGKGQAPKGSRKILRKATSDDISREEKNRERETHAFSVAQDIITERELPMKLIRVEYTFDAARATFFFFSETRIDFRDLVKDLAFKLKSRIEMRQIGVRDVSRMIGGFGPCGRELCCSSFLKNFEPVSIRMAKKQDMVLNPAKISGVCGRLLCCLSYEYEMYDAIKKDVAGMRDAAFKEKKDEEERRVSQEQKEAEERRIAEDRRRQEERRKQEPRREKQKESPRKEGTARPEKKKIQQDRRPQVRPEKAADTQQERKPQVRQDRPAEAQQRKPQGQPQPEPQSQGSQPQQVKPLETQQQDGEKSGRKKKRRFWRRKKKGQQQGENKPPQGSGPGPGTGA